MSQQKKEKQTTASAQGKKQEAVAPPTPWGKEQYCIKQKVNITVDIGWPSGQKSYIRYQQHGQTPHNLNLVWMSQNQQSFKEHFKIAIYTLKHRTHFVQCDNWQVFLKQGSSQIKNSFSFPPITLIECFSKLAMQPQTMDIETD